MSFLESSASVRFLESPVMKVLEVLAGVVIAIVSVLILMVGAAFAFGSIGRYMKAKSM